MPDVKICFVKGRIASRSHKHPPPGLDLGWLRLSGLCGILYRCKMNVLGNGISSYQILRRLKVNERSRGETFRRFALLFAFRKLFAFNGCCYIR
ncbi:hypothetical protein ALC62_09432 [Cyphomyrmex costatus]|uniref:Uncharacterized protein n=1 Tax=Cyphomyrmex costatus TaxID=456900 RepID=A0A195CGE3_9HYME|nr:hypothetical protein ALC62_09432 [Cyphomyrmex costatus]